MKHITLSIKDNKYSFFKELVKNLDFVKITDEDIPEEHKKIVRKRIKNSSPDKLLDWDKAKSKLKFG